MLKGVTNGSLQFADLNVQDFVTILITLSAGIVKFIVHINRVLEEASVQGRLKPFTSRVTVCEISFFSLPGSIVTWKSIFEINSKIILFGPKKNDSNFA